MDFDYGMDAALVPSFGFEADSGAVAPIPGSDGSAMLRADAVPKADDALRLVRLLTL